VDVDRRGGGLDGREAVVVVGGVEQLDVQDRAYARGGLAREAHTSSSRCVLEGLGPAVEAGDDLHAVGAQRVQLADLAVDGDGFQVGVAGYEQEAVPGFEQVGGGCDRIGAGDEVEQRVLGDLVVARIEEQRHAGRGFRDHAHGAIDDGVLHEAFAGEGGIVARRPGGLAQVLVGDERGRCGRLCGRALERRTPA
jgi:hypothetical protein